jgi:nucleoside-diphosphate-sugar epimerase
MKIKVAILGASGVLGRNLITGFQRAGRNVRALVRNPDKVQDLLEKGSEALTVNLLTIPRSLLVEYLKGCDVVIHAATAIPPYGKDSRAWELNNRLRTEGTEKLIETAWRAGVSLYLQQSTVTAYIDGGDKWQDESASYDIMPSRVVETLAVADMERRVREIPRKLMRWGILRLGLFVGAGTPQDLLVERLYEGSEEISGDGNHFISPVHVEDAAEAFVRATQTDFGIKILNIVDEPLRYGDYVDGLADLLEVSRPRRNLVLPKPSSHRCSNEAAGRELDWAPKRDLYPLAFSPVGF